MNTSVSARLNADDPNVVKEIVKKPAEDEKGVSPQIKQFFKDTISPKGNDSAVRDSQEESDSFSSASDSDVDSPTELKNGRKRSLFRKNRNSKTEPKPDEGASPDPLAKAMSFKKREVSYMQYIDPEARHPELRSPAVPVSTLVTGRNRNNDTEPHSAKLTPAQVRVDPLGVDADSETQLRTGGKAKAAAN